MAKKIESGKGCCCCGHTGKTAAMLGALVFLVGLMKYYGIDWPVIAMVAGILILVKGLYIKMRMK